MTETRLAGTGFWPTRVKPEKPPQTVKRLDAKFEEWAKRNNVNLKDIPLMEKKKK